ncbi:MAG: helix-hairpin-helix domain-containing protein [gamma proteobacterium symbiont of Lucinoma myriamae]|nr:helix-hairpin-helix domain-containing protein [gamma proteobacterium symbiont of Lucinoma myriamae]
MKNPNRKIVSKLEQLPNIGKVMAAYLLLIGIEHPQELIGKDPLKLYYMLCEKTKSHHDPCVIDVFMSVVDFMEGGEPLPWWSFTPKRKKILQNRFN